MEQLRRLWHWHRDDRLVALAATPAGQVGVFAIACAALVPQNPAPASLDWVGCGALALAMAFPRRRREWMSLASAVLLLSMMPRDAGVGVFVVALPLCLAFLVGCWWAARQYRTLPTAVRRRPLWTLNLVFCAVLGLCGVWLRFEPAHRVEVSVVLGVLCFVLFRCGFVLLSGRRGSAAHTSFWDHFFYLIPIYGGTAVPYGKGHDYLTQNAAAQREARVRSQLAGLKCLFLAALWRATDLALGGFVHSDPGNPLLLWSGVAGLEVPRAATLIAEGDAAVAGLGIRWLSVWLELLTRTLAVATLGHLVIGALRLFGFHVFRDTYKPLLAETLVDFWNRFHHYFKELLVQLFFFPVYAARFKGHRRLRMFAAVFAAALVGNLYYHSVEHIASSGLPLTQAAWANFGGSHLSRAVYALALTVGIAVSMWREQSRRGRDAPGGSHWLTRARRIAGVWVFFGLIHIWTVQPWTLSVEARNLFFLSLFGWGAR